MGKQKNTISAFGKRGIDDYIKEGVKLGWKTERICRILRCLGFSYKKIDPAMIKAGLMEK